MIVFATSVTDDDLYRRVAAPGIRRAVETDSEVIAMPAAGSIHRSYNRLLDMAANLPDLEALVLLHHDTEIVDSAFCRKCRSALEDPLVGLIGCLGAVGVTSIAYWEGTVTWASHAGRYEEFGGGMVPGFNWDSAVEMPALARTGEVDVIDGFLMVVSPWVVRNIRFDETLSRLHGYDFDFCFQVREAGRRVITADLKAVHHRRRVSAIEDHEEWIDAYVRAAEKWDGRMGFGGLGDAEWRARALRAEARLASERVKRLEAKARAEAKAAQREAGNDGRPPRSDNS